MQVRAKTKDGGKMVTGWLVRTQKGYCVVPDGVRLCKSGAVIDPYATPFIQDMDEIDPVTAAEDTGKDDKNGKRIWGSRSDMGFEGGDKVKFGTHDAIGVCRIGDYCITKTGPCRDHVGTGVWFDFGDAFPYALTTERCSELEVIKETNQ